MNDSTMDDKELVSALADGQLDAQDLARGLQALVASPEARHCWHTYHLIGDILRAPELAAATPSSEFMQRLAQRLARESLPQPEPASLAEAASAVAVVPAVPPVQVPAGAARDTVDIPGHDSANDSRFTWRFRLVAGVASLAAVGVAGWLALGAAREPAQARLALESMPPRVGMVVTPTDKGPMLRDPALDEMLAAHRQLGDVTALQAPAAGLHNATFEPADR